MRTIKFRGKAKYNNKWVYGHYVLTTAHEIIEIHRAGLRNVVYPETIGQFTGLYDKNGNEIYEGDIIEQYTDSRIKSEPKLIEWWNGQFVFKAFNISQSIYEDRDFINFGWWAKDDNTIHQVEIIGNIHDNPELLTEK